MSNSTSQGTTSYNVNGESKCPFSNGMLKKSAGGGTSNRDWWPNQLNLRVLHQNSALSNPLLHRLLPPASTNTASGPASI